MAGIGKSFLFLCRRPSPTYPVQVGITVEGDTPSSTGRAPNISRAVFQVYNIQLHVVEFVAEKRLFVERALPSEPVRLWPGSHVEQLGRFGPFQLRSLPPLSAGDEAHLIQVKIKVGWAEVVNMEEHRDRSFRIVSQIFLAMLLVQVTLPN